MSTMSFVSLLWVGSIAFVIATQEVNPIYKDVAIIGGGVSGAYSAVRLREDYIVTIVVIEKDSMLVSGRSPLHVANWPVFLIYLNFKGRARKHLGRPSDWQGT